jgi:hypothetical protein
MTFKKSQSLPSYQNVIKSAQKSQEESLEIETNSKTWKEKCCLLWSFLIVLHTSPLWFRLWLILQTVNILS